MTAKTYLASTVEAAIALARQELGPDTMLMSSRLSPPDVSHLGRYEVVFAAPAGQSFHPTLHKNDVAPHLINELVNASHMESMISTAADLADTVALVGPPGRGKTSTILKIAVQQGLAIQRPVRILSADNRRFGAFAVTLGVEFQYFETVADLNRALAHSTKALTLIDTSRHVHTNTALARCLISKGVQTHLVLRADAPAEGLLRMVDRYRIFEPARLVLTGLDEVDTFGNLFSVAAQTKLPVSFLSAGQRIPEDLEPATARHLVELVLNRAKCLPRVA